MEKNLLDTLLEMHNSLWVFGYGSLTWNPNFDFSSKEIGHIQGYDRRFWQGNLTHRGTKYNVGFLLHFSIFIKNGKKEKSG